MRVCRYDFHSLLSHHVPSSRVKEMLTDAFSKWFSSLVLVVPRNPVHAIMREYFVRSIVPCLWKIFPGRFVHANRDGVVNSDILAVSISYHATLPSVTPKLKMRIHVKVHESENRRTCAQSLKYLRASAPSLAAAPGTIDGILESQYALPMVTPRSERMQGRRWLAC